MGRSAVSTQVRRPSAPDVASKPKVIQARNAPTPFPRSHFWGVSLPLDASTTSTSRLLISRSDLCASV